MYFLSKSKLKIVLVIVVSSAFIIYYKSLQDILYTDPYIIQFEKGENDNDCYYIEEGDTLPSAEDWEFPPPQNSIFFHETSCLGRLTSRQACAIESAARTNPEKYVYVLFSGPVSDFILKRSNLAKLQLFANIKFARVHFAKYAEKTPLEEIIKSEPFYGKKWWIEHISDVLRCLTLYKWGGISVDTDVLVVKSLMTLGDNWVAKQDENLVNAAAIAISMDQNGRRWVNTFLNELKINYRPDIWIHNGPGAVTRVLHRLCNTHHLAHWSPSTCGGLQVYGPEFFYPVHYSRCRVLFEAGELNNDEHQAYAYHLWNKLTYNMTVEKDSPFMKLAEKYCPTIFQLYSDQFGSIDV